MDLVQKLDPPGVGARDLKECLLLQADAGDAAPRRRARADPATTWTTSRTTACRSSSSKTGFDLDTIKEAIEVLKHLNPRPGAQFTAENIPYVVPDIVVERTEAGEYDGPAARRLDAEHLHQPPLHRAVPATSGRPQGHASSSSARSSRPSG